MADLSAEIAADVLAACTAGATEAAAAFALAFDAPMAVTPGAATTFRWDEPPVGLDGPGLLFRMTVGDRAVAALLPASSPLVPDWWAEPDAAQQSKLKTLARQLGEILMPAAFPVEHATVRGVPDLLQAVWQGEGAELAAAIPLALGAGEASGSLHLIWPLAAAATAGQDRATAAAPAPSAAGQSPPAAATGAASDRAAADSLDRLPRYARSLLRIEVSVTVELATKKQSVAQVLQLCPGAIIRFDKSCEETLELNVGGCTVAEGEAVKVGDKFGLRISSMVLPEERFRAVQLDR